MLYVIDKSRRAEREAFILLASVCCQWRLTLTGWQMKSPTRHWLKHKLKKLMERDYV